MVSNTQSFKIDLLLICQFGQSSTQIPIDVSLSFPHVSMLRNINILAFEIS